MNVTINLPQNNAPQGFGFGPMAGGFGGPMMPGMNPGGGLSIEINRGENHGKGCKKKKGQRSGGLLGGIKDFLRNIGEAIFGEKSEKSCKKGCQKHHHRPPYGGPMASANVVNLNYNLGF